MMELSTFEDLLDRHGGDLAAWPARERDAATALLAISPAAQAQRDTMLDVERVLRRAAVVAAPGATDQIAARAMRHRQETPARRLALRTGWAVAAAIVLVVGIAIGDYGGATRDISPDHVLAVALDSGGTTDVE